MDVVKGKWKKTLMFKAWQRCLSLGAGTKTCSRTTFNYSLTKSKPWHCTKTSSETKNKRKKKCQVAPEGCFSVYVGPQKQRSVIKIKFVNHPLFVMLLEDAELEFGYNSEGPLVLPSDVDLFYKVLAEMDSSEDFSPGCGFAKGYSLILPSPTHRPYISINKGHDAYTLLSPSQSMIRMNQL
ncbi:auxin-responsive protein SAUR71-like [Fagus crenata]